MLNKSLVYRNTYNTKKLSKDMFWNLRIQLHHAFNLLQNKSFRKSDLHHNDLSSAVVLWVIIFYAKIGFYILENTFIQWQGGPKTAFELRSLFTYSTCTLLSFHCCQFLLFWITDTHNLNEGQHILDQLLKITVHYSTVSSPILHSKHE